MPDDAVRAYIGLGSNLGDRLAHLQAAVDALDETPGVRVEAVSSVYRTAPHVLPGQTRIPDYLNAVAAIRTSLPPAALLDACRSIEDRMGRRRGRAWQPRHLDLDLLLYAGARVSATGLTVPHPRMAERRFVLEPLAELAADAWVPEPFSATVRDLLARCDDPLAVALHPAALALPEQA